MGHRLHALEAARADVTAWVGVTGASGPPGALDVEVAGGRRPVGVNWRRWDAHGQPVLWATRVTLGSLQPGTTYGLRLLEGNDERATAVATTLPDVLPRLDEPELSVLLASCFAHDRDAGATAATFAALPGAVRPHLAFLCGDQVYLDAPFPRFLWTRFGDDDLQQVLLGTYLDSWGLMPGRPALGPVLGTGAVFASSDDHEFWNNAPERGAVVRNTWKDHDRETWHTLATDLYRTFQASTPTADFAIEQLSFMVIDTRLARAADRSILMTPEALAALDGWVHGLAGPGVLVLGQTIFSARAGWSGQFTDWGLPDFRQYEDIARILMSSQHDLVVMTGDVHYGRISECRLPSGATLFEVISSPMALVDERAGGHFREPPTVFPAFPIPGTTQPQVRFEPTYRVEGNHFATVGFRSLGPRVRMNVRAWPIPPNGASPVVTHSFERDLG